MFDNPFDSFHKTVGKAKKEREQLDRLLTISTPGEIALVAVTAGVLLLFAAWLFFGDVARSVTVDGVVVAPGEQVDGDRPALQAVVWLEKDVVREIKAGMPASIEVATTDGEAQEMHGKVESVARVGLAEFESPAPLSMQSVQIALEEGSESTSLDGMECRIVIELGSQSPLAFFMRRQS